MSITFKSLLRVAPFCKSGPVSPKLHNLPKQCNQLEAKYRSTQVWGGHFWVGRWLECSTPVVQGDKPCVHHFPSKLNPPLTKLVQSGFCYLADEAACWYVACNPSYLKV